MAKLSKYDELIELFRDNTYPEFIKELNHLIKDPKLKFLIDESYGGLLSNETLNYKVIDIPVRKLIPTQNEIDLDKSLLYPLQAKGDLSSYFKTPVIIVTPLLTFNELFVIDGHHRWSQTYCINRDAKMRCINFSGEFSPISMLKIVQASIAGNLGEVPVAKVDGINMLKVEDEELVGYIQEFLSDKTEKFLMNRFPELENRDDVVEYIRLNCKELINNNTPIIGAPDRGLMPQTTEDPEAIEDIKYGVRVLSDRSFSIKS